MKFLILTLLILVLSPVALCEVQLDAGMILQGTGGLVSFSGNANATDVVIASGVTFTGLTYTGTTYPSLNLSPSSSVNVTVTGLHPDQLIVTSSASAAQTIGAGAGTRTVSAVTGAASWSGTTTATIVPTVGTSIITIMFGGNGGGGLGGGTALIVVVAIIFLALILGKRH